MEIGSGITNSSWLKWVEKPRVQIVSCVNEVSMGLAKWWSTGVQNGGFGFWSPNTESVHTQLCGWSILKWNGKEKENGSWREKNVLVHTKSCGGFTHYFLFPFLSLPLFLSLSLSISLSLSLSLFLSLSLSIFFFFP